MEDEQVTGLDQYGFGSRHVVIHDFHVAQVGAGAAVGHVLMDRLAMGSRQDPQATVFQGGLADGQPEPDLG